MTRDEMIDALVDDTIQTIMDDAPGGDYSLLSAVIRGNAGFTQYSAMTDQGIEQAYSALNEGR